MADPSSGLTLVYCMWHNATAAKTFKNLGALTDCSIVLYIMAERWPTGRKYRDLFEIVKGSVLEAIEEGGGVPCSAVTAMKDEVHTSLQKFGGDTSMDSVADDLEQMIGDMTGGTLSIWQDDSLLQAGLDSDSTTFDQSWDPPENMIWYSNGFLPGQHDSAPI
jgi:hypothetical protein